MTERAAMLVAGVGNIFFGDDAFGVEVVRRLRERYRLEGVEVADFGIRGIDLAYALGGCEAAIVVDTVRRGGAPGTLYLLEPEVGAERAAFEPHGLTPDRVLRWTASESRTPAFLRVVGCEPATLEPSDDGSLSEPVARAVEEAARMVESLVRQWRREGALDA
jgi:hydrogenase maturation protease